MVDPLVDPTDPGPSIVSPQGHQGQAQADPGLNCSSCTRRLQLGVAVTVPGRVCRVVGDVGG